MARAPRRRPWPEALELTAPLLADERWRALFEELRHALRETADLEAQVLDEGLSASEWTALWAQYAGLLGRIGHLHQRLQARRIELLDD